MILIEVSNSFHSPSGQKIARITCQFSSIHKTTSGIMPSFISVNTDIYNRFTGTEIACIGEWSLQLQDISL